MSSHQSPILSIVIPTLNEAGVISETLASLSLLSIPLEVIVVDGGSSDNTKEVAGALGARVINSERGRGRQLHAGACAARGPALWFLHADTQVPPNAGELIQHALRNQRVVGGNFELQFAGRTAAARFMTWLYPRLRTLGLCYGDSSFFVRRESYELLGGFKSLPIFEDLDLLRKLRKIGQFVHLPATVVTSSRRFEGHGFPITFARWAGLQVLYWLGVSPHRLARLYLP